MKGSGNPDPQRGPRLPPFWPRSRKTDAEGRFTLEGVPQGTYATLTFKHPDYAVDEVHVNTTVDGATKPWISAFEIVPVKPSFTYTLEPARPVQGRVTDKASSRPLAGMLVEMTPMRRHGGMRFSARTDADGRFRISGHQADGYWTTVYPPPDSGYLGVQDKNRSWPSGAKFLEVNFALEKGRVIQGHVIDRDTKEPVPGAAVVYQPARRNPYNTRGYDLRNTVLTDSKGRFTTTTLPGEGLLAVEAPEENYMRSQLKDTMYGRTAYPHGHATISVPKDGDPKPVEIAVRRGVTLEARVLDPDGRIVPEVTAMYPGIDAKLIDIWNQGHPFFDGIFRIRGADPDRTYRVFFIKPQARLGGIAELKYDPRASGPLEVKLQPTATVRGKLATPEGSIPQGATVYPSLVLSADRKELSRHDLANDDMAQFYAMVLGEFNMSFQNNQATSNGEFTLEAMIPGARFYIMAGGSGREATVPVSELKPGEVRDLGTITLKERQR